MPHFHIPLQSGDDTILKKMNRRYQRQDFARLIEKIHTRLPHAAIGVDVLVGFPGEDEEAFDNTYSLLESLPVTYLHVFPYSKRPGTVAAGCKSHVPGKIKDERVGRLRQLDRQKKEVFYRKHLGTELQVLCENKKNRFKLMRGFSENYIPVLFAAPEKACNSIVRVTLEKLEDGFVFGKMS